jgi:quinol-cytochrome oxidoreductase complex cytochrome b subunit
VFWLPLIFQLLSDVLNFSYVKYAVVPYYASKNLLCGIRIFITQLFNKGPLVGLLNSHIVDYPTPSNLNYAWGFGSICGLTLIFQLVSGILLSMHYTPDMDLAFLSIEFFMRQIDYGWLVRYGHANGASVFFGSIYLHMARGIYYSSYSYPRGQLWVSGMVIFVLVMATAFMGYVLPWGQMSFWGVTVITNLFTAIPFVGQEVVEWFWGGWVIRNPTLKRIYSLHYTMPFIIAGVAVLHLSLLHRDGSNNPLGCDSRHNVICFYPYFYSKDLLMFSLFLAVLSGFVFFAPNYLGHSYNYIVADYYKTPKHIVPEWYFLPFYAILRSIPDKVGGVLVMGGSIVMLFVFPLLQICETRSPHFRPGYQFVAMLFIFNFIILGYLGQCPIWSPYYFAGQCSTFFYFFFLFLLGYPVSFIEGRLFIK